MERDTATLLHATLLHAMLLHVMLLHEGHGREQVRYHDACQPSVIPYCRYKRNVRAQESAPSKTRKSGCWRRVIGNIVDQIVHGWRNGRVACTTRCLAASRSARLTPTCTRRIGVDSCLVLPHAHTQICTYARHTHEQHTSEVSRDRSER